MAMCVRRKIAHSSKLMTSSGIIRMTRLKRYALTPEPGPLALYLQLSENSFGGTPLMLKGLDDAITLAPLRFLR